MTASILKQDPNTKGSNERLFILTWTHSTVKMSGKSPLYQAPKQHLNNR